LGLVAKLPKHFGGKVSNLIFEGRSNLQMKVCSGHMTGFYFPRIETHLTAIMRFSPFLATDQLEVTRSFFYLFILY
jgi:hypothetical protein